MQSHQAEMTVKEDRGKQLEEYQLPKYYVAIKNEKLEKQVVEKKAVCNVISYIFFGKTLNRPCSPY